MCSLCSSTFSISNKGKYDLEQHLNSEKHKKNIRASTSSGVVTSFFASTFSKQSHQIAAAEGTLAFHTVRHHFSFRSCDCSHNLLKFILPDSKIAKKILCARTKTEAIVTGVLAPLSIDILIKDLRDVEFISVATDASNHGDKKLFPVFLQYYSNEFGITVKLIKIKALPNETSQTVFEFLTEVLKKHNLLKKVVEFSADNCNTKFGGLQRAGKNNKFAKLKSSNPALVGIGCPAHILHNNAQYGFDGLPIDVESIVMKIYNYFSIYTVRVEKLKDFCEFADLGYKQLLNHSKTRWLSLFPCVQRILEIYEALKSYFLSIENPPVVLKLFFQNE